ncbi:uncharacterized protein LOC110851605 [Folsomia candida]|uniref:uncharacterized protein LOC110851605 n=1 Tax=Folsomia candida TaxID=158441 RepID=UPI000B8EF968|nr:uncharacterized protein LOC110851605 [Folsomia candida]
MRFQIYFGLVALFVLGCGVGDAEGENFEFHLSNAMLITSLRLFEQTSDSFYVFRAKNGSIILKADSGFGIMAVVQEMNLQDIINPIGCLDSIKMSQVEGSSETKSICGNVELTPDSSILTPRPSYVDKSGFLELDYVLTEKNRISPLDRNITNFNVSFTPFTKCPEEDYPFGNGLLRPCSMLDTFSCISADFFCDGVINCGFPHELGLDEQDCDVKDVPAIHLVQPEDLDQSAEGGELLQLPNKLPYDPYITLEDEDDTARLKQQRQLSFLIWKYSNTANTGLFVVIVMFVLILVKTQGGRRTGPRGGGRGLLVARATHHALPTSIEDKSGVSSTTDSSVYYDAETDPAPTYEDCLLDDSSRPVYTALSVEHERPPSYEEVRVHRGWSTNFSKRERSSSSLYLL